MVPVHVAYRFTICPYEIVIQVRCDRIPGKIGPVAPGGTSAS